MGTLRIDNADLKLLDKQRKAAYQELLDNCSDDCPNIEAILNMLDEWSDIQYRKAYPERAMTINMVQKLFIIPAGDGFSTLGFSNCYQTCCGLASELGGHIPVPPNYEDAKEMEALYAYYLQLMEKGHKRHLASGWRSQVHLHHQLQGLEGHRVEVEEDDGEKRRFLVGRSTGWMPCHIELKSVRSSDGCSAGTRPYRSVKVIK